MKELIIIGTAHVSKESAEEVKRVIEEKRPDAVAVELCPRRYRALIEGYREEIPLTDLIKKGETFLLLFQIVLSHFQRKIAKEYGVRVGEEMIAAIEKAREIGADVLLIDRDIAITFKRFWQSLSFIEKLKLLYHLLKDLFSKEEIDVKEILREDILDRIVREFRSIAPNAAKVLIDERDKYMAMKLIEAMQRYDKIVAVVGAGHKRGIERFLKELSNVDLKSLEEVKSGISIFRILSIIISVIILSAFVITAVLNFQAFIEAFIFWFLINGILAAIGAAIARAHPISITLSFLSAWLTSLNPMIAAGWIAALSEVWIRKPTISDLAKLVEAESFRELFNNKIFRILLVAALTNIGSMIGTIYGGYYILSHFGIDIAKEISNRFKFF